MLIALNGLPWMVSRSPIQVEVAMITVVVPKPENRSFGLVYCVTNWPNGNKRLFDPIDLSVSDANEWFAEHGVRPTDRQSHWYEYDLEGDDEVLFKLRWL